MSVFVDFWSTLAEVLVLPMLKATNNIKIVINVSPDKCIEIIKPIL